MKVGGIRCKISSKKGSFGVGTKKMGSFLVWTPENGGHSVCKNAISSQNAKTAKKLLNFSKCLQRVQKNCDLYVTFDTKVEKGGHWVWTE